MRMILKPPLTFFRQAMMSHRRMAYLGANQIFPWTGQSPEVVPTKLLPEQRRDSSGKSDSAEPL
jgi:hypothetical protein